jgi:hypothetical protein
MDQIPASRILEPDTIKRTKTTIRKGSGEEEKQQKD